MQARLDRLYGRLGPDYVRPFFGVVFAFGTFVGVGGAWILSLYVDPSAAEFLELAIVAAIVTNVGLGWGAWVATRRYWYPIQRWIREGRSSDGAASAWHGSVNYPRIVVIGAYWRAFLASALPILAYSTATFDLSAAETLSLLAAILAGSIYPTLILAGLLEYYLRPIVRDAVGRIPAGHEHPEISLPLRTRLLATLPLITVISGVFVAVFSHLGDASLEDLGMTVVISLGVSATLALPLVTLLAESLLTPIESLTSATRQTRAGDLSARLPVISSDELGVLTSSFNQMTSELGRSQKALVNAQQQERQRLRRDLHDGLGPALSGVRLQLEAAAAMLDRPDNAREVLERSSIDLGDAIADVRRLIYELRPANLDRLGLAGAIRKRADQLTVNGSDGAGDLAFSVDAPEIGNLPAPVEIAALRIVEEAMNNVVRHSAATACSVHLRAGTALEISVTDNGRGIGEDVSEGVGMSSMRERAEGLGGHLEVTTGPAGGTIVTTRLPLLSR